MNPNPVAWLGLAFALVVLGRYPGMAEAIRLSLVLVIAYVALSHATQFAPALNRLTAALAGRPYLPPGSKPAR